MDEMNDSDNSTPPLGVEAGSAEPFVCSEALRESSARISRLALVAGTLALLRELAAIVDEGVSELSIMSSALLLAVAVFLLLAGWSLRRLSRPEGTREDLAKGLSYLHGVFLTRGLMLLILVACGLGGALLVLALGSDVVAGGLQF
ncbi:hypothetical protein G6O69_19260 [Pseudenhygromyxa sp. WMMC2535]|uniref:hypothetical protein n=1 Tax=Pseudenhygromyxa sp. WMMC2535 TaxID=2712867 RepID=UPI0015519086|nr:hypothetical protein [Pseudenhygromyxa sp. WMMC2535]NVB39992.1 hypothetical protein [Pseudenhygromyxa sp. WMMC2535]